MTKTLILTKPGHKGRIEITKKKQFKLRRSMPGEKGGALVKGKLKKIV